jgi:hypothetical protein
MYFTDITTGIQAVSAAGAVPGVLDTSAMSGDFAVYLSIHGLDPGKTATIAIEDTASASAFSDANQLAT